MIRIADWLLLAADVLPIPRIPRTEIGPKIDVRKPKKRKFKGSKAARKAGRK